MHAKNDWIFIGVAIVVVSWAATSKGSNLTNSIQSQASSNLALTVIADWTEQQVITNLAKALLPPTQDVSFATTLLKTIRDRHMVKLRTELERMVEELERIGGEPQIRRFDPSKALAEEVRKTIAYLEMDVRNLATPSVRAEFLMKRIEMHVGRGENFGGELAILQEQASAITSNMLAVLDSNALPKLKEVALLVLGRSQAENLETEILARADRYSDDKFLYPRIMLLLSEIGGRDSVGYIMGVAKRNQPGLNVAIVKLCLEKLRKRTNDPVVKAQISKALESKLDSNTSNSK